MDAHPIRGHEGGLSPRSFAIQHQRARTAFVGCSRIADYEVLGKLGEGTFGYVRPEVPLGLAPRLMAPK